MLTFLDAMHHLYDLAGANLAADLKRICRRATQGAYRDVTTASRWSYLQRHGRITITAPYSTGTVAYTHTGGAYERVLTLTGGTWPTWANAGVVLIASVLYDVDERKSATQITLRDQTNPGADVAAGTTYKLYRDTYSLPADFIAADDVQVGEPNYGRLQYVAPADWINYRLASNASTNRPYCYTFAGDPELPNRMAVRFYPLPDAAYNIDFGYHRRPRQPLVFEEKTGKISTTSGSATITGGTAPNATAFTSLMVGGIIRIKATNVTGTVDPVSSGPWGVSRELYYVHERTITAVASATSLTVDSNIPETLSTVDYVITDPVEIEETVMGELFFRACERQLRMMSYGGSQEATAVRQVANQEYMQELMKAKEQDSRSFARRYAGEGRPGFGMEAWRRTGADVA